MRKAFAALMAAVMVVTCLTGCMKSKAFDPDGLAAALRKYGMEEVDDYQELNRFVMGRSISGFYVSKDDEDVQKTLFNENYEVPDTESSKIKKALIAVDADTDNNYLTYSSTSIILAVFENSSDAESFYESRIRNNTGTDHDYYDNASGEKNGYRYTVMTLYDEYGTDAYLKAGAYFKGNTVLVITSTVYDPGQPGLAAYIFKDLGIVEPKTRE